MITLSFLSGAIVGAVVIGFFCWCYVSVLNDDALNPIAELGNLPKRLNALEIDAHVQTLGGRFHNNKTGSIVVATVTGDEVKCYSFGLLPKGAPPDENTVFEIASVGKTLTALLVTSSAFGCGR